MVKLVAAAVLTIVFTLALEAGWNLGIAAAMGLPGVTFWQAFWTLVLLRVVAILLDNRVPDLEGAHESPGQ